MGARLEGGNIINCIHHSSSDQNQVVHNSGESTWVCSSPVEKSLGCFVPVVAGRFVTQTLNDAALRHVAVRLPLPSTAVWCRRPCGRILPAPELSSGTSARSWTAGGGGGCGWQTALPGSTSSHTAPRCSPWTDRACFRQIYNFAG